jgi:hypothetical protein
MTDSTRHTVKVIFEREDRDEQIDAGERTFYGKDYHAFSEADARALLLEEGDLVITPELVTFGGTIVPTAKLDRIRVKITSKSVGS